MNQTLNKLIPLFTVIFITVSMLLVFNIILNKMENNRKEKINNPPVFQNALYELSVLFEYPIDNIKFIKTVKVNDMIYEFIFKYNKTYYISRYQLTKEKIDYVWKLKDIKTQYLYLDDEYGEENEHQ